MGPDSVNTPAAQWSIYNVGTLNESAFIASAPWPGAKSYSVTFWYTARDIQRTQVIVSQGGTHVEDPGWRVTIGESLLTFTVIDDELDIRYASIAAPPPNTWAQVIASIDTSRRIIRLQARGVASVTARATSVGVTPMSEELVVGGYTDPAGGHFDRTFGRNSSGLVDDVRIFTKALPLLEPIACETATFAEPMDLTITPDSLPHAPSEVTFRVKAHDHGPIRAYVWDFPDGSRTLGGVATHHFEFGGAHTVSLTAIDRAYRTFTVRKTITVPGERYPFSPVAVFPNTELGYACFRIPSIVCHPSGTLVAFCEGRVDSCSDSTPRIRAVCRRSEDNGHTWGDLEVVAQNHLGSGEHSVMNVSPVVDRVHGTGRIVLLYNTLEHTEWEIARGIGENRVQCITSDNGGVSWSEPVDITRDIRGGVDWRIQRPTLGHGIQLTEGRFRGRIVHAGMFTENDDSVFRSSNYLFYTDDLGATWHIAGVVPRKGLNEATLAEIGEGKILVNSRSYNENEEPAGARALTVGIFDDQDSATFQTTYLHPSLIDSGLQGAMLRYFAHDANTLLFANPANARIRKNLTVRLSHDGGLSWPVHRSVDPGPAAYNDLVCTNDGCIGTLYEAGNTGGIQFLSFSLDWLQRQKSC